jgi:hypothetical protein
MRNLLLNLHSQSSGRGVFAQMNDESFTTTVPSNSLRSVDGVHYADQGNKTILPPTPPLSMRAWTSLAAASGSRSITTG